MGPLKDDRGESFRPPAKLEDDIRYHRDTIKFLSYEDGQVHSSMLSSMLRYASRLVVDDVKSARDPKERTDFMPENRELSDYIARLAESVDLLSKYHELVKKKGDDDVIPEYSIVHLNSGFPTFPRDFGILRKHKENASARLESLPTDRALVERALFSVFRGYFPSDVVVDKIARDFYSGLAEIDFPTELKINETELVNRERGVAYYKKSVERLDGRHNLPRFYYIYLSTPYTIDGLEAQIEGTIGNVLSGTSPEIELPVLARALEDIDIIDVQLVERFDIGPFYNRFTSTDDSIGALLDGAGSQDSILVMKKLKTVRFSERRRQGWHSLKQSFFGGTNDGVFSPVLQSPEYTLLPHRLIQKAHHLDLKLKGVQMFGITSDGDLVD